MRERISRKEEKMPMLIWKNFSKLENKKCGGGKG